MKIDQNYYYLMISSDVMRNANQNTWYMPYGDGKGKERKGCVCIVNARYI